MGLAGVTGALGFLTRLRVGASETAWIALRESPWTFPIAGYVIGALAALPLALTALGVPATTVTAVYLLWVFALTGINHLDGIADVGDAVVVHGDPDDRRAVLKDTTVGVGAVTAVGLTLVALTLGAFGVLTLPLWTGAIVVVAAEVGAKLGLAAVACLGTATHDGLGSQFTAVATPRDLSPAGVVALPAILISWPSPVAAGALTGGIAAGLLVLWRANALFGGVSGDVFGVVNEVGRLAGLHAGVVVWTLS